MLRLIQMFIVLFWTGTTSWLIWTVWNPNGSGFTKMDEKEVIDTFFNWNETDVFSIIENGRRIGTATISASTGVNRRNGTDVIREFSIICHLYKNESLIGNPDGISVSWRVNFEFDDSDPMNLNTAQITMGMPEQEMSMITSLHNNPSQLRVLIRMHDIKIFDFKGAPEEMPEIPGMFTSGIAASFLGDINNPTEAFKPEITAFRGEQTFGGRHLPVFLIKIKVLGQQSDLRFFLSQAGEPIKLETDFGFEATSDVWVPVKRSGSKQPPTPTGN